MPETTFDRIPALVDLLSTPGLPGVEYALVTPDHAARMMQEPPTDEGSWKSIQGLGLLTVKGKPAYLVGRGAPIRGVSPLSGRVVYRVDREFDDNPPNPIPSPTRPKPSPDGKGLPVPGAGAGNPVAGKATSNP